MKKILILLVPIALGLMPCGVSAQTYESLWKEARGAMEKDQPRTALDAVERVLSKAQADGDDGQRLRALLTRYQLQGELSPDSATAEIARLETLAASEQRPAVRALWQSALGKLLRTWADTAAVSRGRACLRASLSDFDALGRAKATDYLPLFTRGADSRYYGDDLLSVLAAASLDADWMEPAERRDLHARILRYYSAQGNRPATLLATLDSLSHDNAPVRDLSASTSWPVLQRLAAEYADLPLNVETYIAMTALPLYGPTRAADDSTLLSAARMGISLYGKQPRANVLRNFVARTTLPTLSCTGLPRTLYPGNAYTVDVQSRNVGHVQLRLYRLEASATEPALRNGVMEEIWKLKKKLVRTEKMDLSGVREYGYRTDTLRFTAPAAGVYVCELLADGKRLDRQEVYVSRLLAVDMSVSPTYNRLAVVDAASGTPVPGARLVEYARGAKLQRAVHTADAEGFVHLRGQRNGARELYPVTDDDRFHPAVTATPLYGSSVQSTAARTTVCLFTDRAIYRPGQKVLFGGVAYTQQGDEVNTAAGYQAEVRLTDSNGKEVARMECRTDEFGGFSGEFSLPEVCLPGHFSVRTGEGAASAASVYFRVEEYKRPTFTVETEDVTVAYALGDTVTVCGTARTYTGLPVADAKVAYRVARNFYFATADSRAVSGEAVTDSAGRFRIPVVLSGESGEAPAGWMPARLRYIYNVQIDITADNGETASASRRLYASSRPSAVETDWPSTLCKEQLPRVTVRNTNAAGTNLPGAGTYTLWVRTDSQRGDAAVPESGGPAAHAEKSTLGADSFALGAEKSTPNVENPGLGAGFLRVASGGRFPAGIYKRVGQGCFETGVPFVPGLAEGLPSGEYLAVSAVDGAAEADTAALLLFSEADVRPAGTAVCWSHVRQSAAGDSALVMVGSPERGVTLFYDLVANGEVVESRRMAFTDSLLRFQLAYRPEYGDGAKAVWAFVRDGQLHTVTATVQRPLPDKRLHLRWSTFRSPLTPGQHEEWRLTVTRPDGTPADAMLMACLYDASLDAFSQRTWDFGLHFDRSLPRSFYRSVRAEHIGLGGSFDQAWKSESPLAFTCWDPELLVATGGRGRFRGHGVPLMSRSRNVKMAQASGVAYDTAVKESVIELSELKTVALPASGAAPAPAPVPEMPEVEARSNFAETAFFQPALRTDSTGTVTLSFTLPESLTSWNFNALARTVAMDWGRMDTTAVARKEFMVQAAMPRFVREGDRAEVPATVRNLSDKPVEGTLQCTFADARTGRTLKTLRQKFALLPGGAMVYGFTLEATDGVAVYTVRVVATGGEFSDGEEHYLPVLADRVAVTRTLPFSLTDGGPRTLRIDTLWAGLRQAADRRLTVEVSSNPTWYAVTALPALAGGESRSATEWAARYYAVTLADYMAQQVPGLRKLLADSTATEAGAGDVYAWADVLKRNPDLKQLLLEETPWVAEGETEASRTAALRSLFDERVVAANRYTALDRLKALQRPDGAWAWYPGMPANRQVTLEVATLLARLQSQSGDSTATDALSRCLAYLEKEVGEDVARMKELEKKNKKPQEATEWHLRYLYVRTLLGAEATGQAAADEAYLLKRLEKPMTGATMYAKSLAALVLARHGKAAAARDFLKSVAEHTVAQEGMGRWFDTDRAAWSWNAYRIPTQTAAIEAFTECARLRLCACPDGGHEAGCPLSSDYIGQMRLWLLQSRRTQLWQTSRAATDAVYALLMNDADAAQPLVAGLESTFPLYYTLNRKNVIVAANAGASAQSPQMAGYFLHAYDAAPAVEADAITLRKKEGGLAWGAVFAQYTLPVSEVRPAANGLSLERRLEVRRGTEWVAVDGKTALRPGDRVRQVLTVKADRDYDFVSLRSARAACMEPARPLSGYMWTGTAGCYRVVRDASTDFFFEQLRKGTHVLTDEYFLDRSGNYQCGTATVQSIYAPEFCGTAPGQSVHVD